MVAGRIAADMMVAADRMAVDRMVAAGRIAVGTIAGSIVGMKVARTSMVDYMIAVVVLHC